MHIANWKSFCGLCLVLSMAACSLRQTAGPSAEPVRADQLDAALAAVVADPVHGMASLSVLAVRQGQVVYQRGFGQRYIDPADPTRNRPAAPDTLYRIASVSKLVTMLGVMRLVEGGKLALDRDVSDYLGYRLRNPAYPDQALTLRMLLSHTASLRDEGGYRWGAGVTLKAALQAEPRVWDRRHRPGAYFSYSNLNWGVIGTVMEAATGERFDILMQKLVLDPLELSGGFNVAALQPAAIDRLAVLYRKRDPEGERWKPDGPWIAQVDDYPRGRPAPPAGLDGYAVGANGTLFSPTGGLRASAQDLGKIMLMLLDDGRHGGRAFLSPASLAEIFSTQWRHDPAAVNGDTHHGLFQHWGLGVQHFGTASGAADSLVPGGGYAASGHLGEASGLLSVFAFNPRERSGVVVLIGGTATDPYAAKGQYSALSRQEELVLSALHRHALQVP